MRGGRDLAHRLKAITAKPGRSRSDQRGLVGTPHKQTRRLTKELLKGRFLDENEPDPKNGNGRISETSGNRIESVPQYEDAVCTDS